MQNHFLATGSGRLRSIAAFGALLSGLLWLGLSWPAMAIQPEQPGQQRSRLQHVPKAAAGLDVQPDVRQGQSMATLAATDNAVSQFLASYGGQWQLRLDQRSGKPNLIQGSGVPLYAGRGNSLAATTRPQKLAEVNTLVQRFVRANQGLLGVAGMDLRLDKANSAPYGNGDSHWFVQLDQYANGVRVKGAFVFVRLSQGNVVQFGNNRVVPVNIDTTPSLGQRAALNAMMGQLRFLPDTRVTRLLNHGELLVLPRAADRKAVGLRYSGAVGAGYDHVLAWHYTFRVNDDPTTYDVLVDADSGQVLSVENLNVYAQAEVKGNVYTTDHVTTQSVGMPFASVSNGGSKTTDLDGKYDYTGGSASVALDGKYFKIVDNCGSISLSNSTDGNLDLGSNTGTDCTTPGFGGAGNTNASRSAFYNLTLINRKAITFFPSNSWLQGKVTAEVNENDTCNAFWDGSSLNFFKSSPGSCANTGEIPGVFLHEWGHGMDTNSGGAASENGSGEAVGDTFAMLETKESCIGMGFFTDGSTCYNCNTGCTGVRDAAAFSLNGPSGNVIASPATITDDNGVDADRGACPYFTPQGYAYQGPMGYEGHLESYIASSANWDLAQALVAEYGAQAGWQQMDKIWYGSLVPSKSAYQVVSGGQCNVNATVDGCGASNWYTVYLTADDDDGNLANGTPNACRIYDAFQAHGIACGTRPVCTPTTPDFTLSSASTQASVCAAGNTDFTIDIGATQGFSNPVTLSAGSPPTGIGASFAPNPVNPGNSSTMHVTTTAATAGGDYTLTASGTASGSAGHSLDFALKVFSGSPAVPTLQSPTDGAVGQNPQLTLSWSAVVEASSYSVQVATDAAFTNIVDSTSGLTAPNYQPAGLAPSTTYYWRVSAENACGPASSAVASFTTANLICSSPALTIPDGDSNGVSDVIHLSNGNALNGMTVAIKSSHGWVGDLKFTLSHAGTDVVLINRPGVGGSSSYGCGDDDIDVTLDDAAATSVQGQCNSTPPAIGGTQQPFQALSAFVGQAASGDWTLTAADEASIIQGTLDQWCLILDVPPPSSYTVGGTLGGLSGTVVLQVNGGDDLSLTADGPFSFSQALTDLSNYHVSVSQQPAGQICTVANGSGQVNGGNVTNVAVTCSDNTAGTYSVGGALTGLASGKTVTVQLNGANDLVLSGNGGFTFAQTLADSSSYAVTVSSQPTGQLCTVGNGSGTISGADIGNVAVTCGDPPPPEWTIGGQTTGLTGSGLVLQVNGGNDLPIAASGPFSFANTLTDGTAWTVSILSQPSGQTCQLGNASGTATADVNDIQVQCAEAPVSDRLFADGFESLVPPFAQPLGDPGFEATTAAFGTNPNWDGNDSHSAGTTPFCDGSCSNGGTIPTQDGDWAVWFGAWNAATPSQMDFSQSVTIASGGPRYLRYWRVLGIVPDGVTTLKILVDGNVVSSVDLTVLAAETVFSQRSLDISAYADDAAHTIKFQFDNDASGSTDGSLFIDMVTIGNQPLMPPPASPAHADPAPAMLDAVRAAH